MTNYSIPEDITIGGALMMNDREMTKVAIENAADYLDDHPDYTPQFQLFANVICCKSDRDSEFVRAVVPKDSSETVLGVDMMVFATSVLWIKKDGWDGYIKQLRNREIEEGHSVPFFSTI